MAQPKGIKATYYKSGQDEYANVSLPRPAASPGTGVSRQGSESNQAAANRMNKDFSDGIPQANRSRLDWFHAKNGLNK